MSQPYLLAYLDHNVLDLMSKGDPDRVGNLLRKASLTPIFSDENLAEIRRSTGYEQIFLALLERIEARYLVPVLDEQFNLAGNAEVRLVSPFDAYRRYLENADSLPGFDFGLLGMLQKFYGGRQNQSFEEIFADGADELKKLLQKLRGELADSPDLDDRVLSAFAEVAASVPDTLAEQNRNFAAQLDAGADSAVKRLEEATGLGPKVLKNIKRPDVVRKIWALVEPKLSGADVDMETFFGIKAFPFEKNAGRERTILEKVNAIYHQLNFLGYYRDSKMNKQRRFTASFSDMTHAGLASFCKVLICRDDDLVIKAAAAYEYLGVGTRILHYGANNGMEPTH